MAREDTKAGSVGELVKTKELSTNDIEALFDGRTTLPLAAGFALVLPAWKSLTPLVQEVAGEGGHGVVPESAPR